MLVLNLDRDLEKRLTALARRRRCSKSHIVREAILRLIEDAEDLEVTKRALRDMRSRKSLRDIKKALEQGP